jgi:hypothetical protein
MSIKLSTLTLCLHTCINKQRHGYFKDKEIEILNEIQSK